MDRVGPQIADDEDGDADDQNLPQQSLELLILQRKLQPWAGRALLRRCGHGTRILPKCGGSEVRITSDAISSCGLLNQSHTRSTNCRCPFDSEARKRGRRNTERTSESGHWPSFVRRRVSNVAPNPKVCNICFMAQPARSPLDELCSALPSLPTRLRQVGRFVAANDYDATTRSMRELASVAGADPASFTRLAKAIG